MAETIGLIILTAFSAADLATVSVIGTLTVAQLIGTTAILAGTILASELLTPNANAGGVKPSDGQITTRQSLPSRLRSYGRVKVAGPLMFSETANGAHTQIIAIHQGEVDAFEEHWLASFHVALAGDNSVIGQYIEAGVGPRIFIYFQVGDGITDDNFALDAIPAYAAIWTTAAKGLGVAKVLVNYLQTSDSAKFLTVYAGGTPPPYRAVVRASKVWDPRDGGQNKDDPTTWTWSINPVLQILDFHRHADGMRLSALDSVLFPSAALTEDWIPAANICDEAITLAAGGTEPRYQCSGTYELPAAPKDILGAMLATCFGQTYQRTDGAIGIRVGKTIDSSVHIADKHILGYQGFRTGKDAFRTINEVKAQFTWPRNDYQQTDAQSWRDDADITARGQILTETISLLWVPSFSQARRLMKLEMARKNPDWSGNVITDLYGLNAYTERFVRLTIAELGITDRTFEVLSIAIDPSTMNCTLGVSSLDQSALDWDPATEEGTAPVVAGAGPGPATSPIVVTIDTPSAGDVSSAIVIPNSGTITGWQVDESGNPSINAVLDVWVAAGTPTVADTITDGHKPTISASDTGSGAPTSWSTALVAGHSLKVHVDSLSLVGAGAVLSITLTLFVA